ncbi:alpha/beta hydrolase [Halorientalis salina]|uniref:alpha/beta hydrolase n=1 Tax=Halorientalis salina TaxID=2932266 RepID=UPI0010AC2C46|nr:alpha/beta hydrolase [Halorientalis salina]
MSDQPHPQVQAILQLLEDQSVPPIYSLSVENARQQMENFAAMREGEPVEEVQNFEIQGPAEALPVRLYLPDASGPHPVLVFYHGGGFVVGSLDTHDALARGLTNAAECAVLSVDYRLAPEHPFPAAVEDAYAAVEWVREYGDTVGLDPERIAVGGDSAGGNLAAATTLAVRDRGGPALAHQTLIYPAVSSPVLGEFDSYEENAEGYFLERRSMEWFVEQYITTESDVRNEYFAPLLARDLSSVPPATVVTAGFDPLRDEGRAYADRLREDGIDVEHHSYEDMIHGFASMLGAVDAAEDAVERMGHELQASF